MTTTVSGGIEKMLWLMICFLPFYSIGRILWRRKQEAVGAKERHSDRMREIALALFALFMFSLLVLTFENNGFTWLKGNILLRARRRLKIRMGVNFVPFHTIRRYLKYSSSWENITVNIAGNIVMFLPWGMGLPLLWKKNQKILKVTFMSVLLPVVIEFLQLFIGRSVDIDDVILNFTGGMLGGLLYLVLVKIFPGLKKLAR